MKRGYAGKEYQAQKRFKPTTRQVIVYPNRVVAQAPRVGYGSVARARGAAVTGEMKYYDTELVAAAISACTTTWIAGTLMNPSSSINLGDAAVATPLCLFAPKVSAALNGRIGRKVRVMKIRINGTVSAGAQSAHAAADNAPLVRLMLVQDCQTNAAAMTAAQLMNDATSATATINSMQNPNNFGRFKVLKQKKITLSNLSMTGSPTGADVILAGVKIPFKFNVKFKVPIDVHFNATNGGTVADIVDNSFHIVCGCDSTGPAEVLAYYCRVAYKE